MMQKLMLLLKERMPLRYYPLWVGCGLSWTLILMVLILGLNAIADGRQAGDVVIFLMNVAGMLILTLTILPVIDLVLMVWFDYVVPLRCGCGKS